MPRGRTRMGAPVVAERGGFLGHGWLFLFCPEEPNPVPF
jgi:hypothetical protein